MANQFINKLVQDVYGYADRNNGRIYSSIDHPAFDGISYHHGPERFTPIAENISKEMKNALDIGSHWGFFSHKLEGLGLDVTATEILPSNVDFLERIRELHNDKFSIWSKSVLEMDGILKYDVVLALNILHHFIKTEDLHNQLIDFLKRLQCKKIFFQSHSTKEGQMKNAFANYEAEDFCKFIIKNVPNLNYFRKIAQFRNRPMFVIE